MSLFPQDPAEAFLLAQVPSVAGPSSSSTYGKRELPTELVPPSLSLKSRRLSRSRRSGEAVRRGEEFAGVTLGGVSEQDNVNEEGNVDAEEEEDEHRRRIPSPEEHRVWTERRQQARQAQLDASRPNIPSNSSSNRTRTGSQWHPSNLNLDLGTGIMVAEDKLGQETPGDEIDDDDIAESGEMCVICLQPVQDRTIVGDCDHSIFCFDCINVWSNQSRKCPLCTAPMREFLVHGLDRRTGPVKVSMSSPHGACVFRFFRLNEIYPTLSYSSTFPHSLRSTHPTPLSAQQHSPHPFHTAAPFLHFVEEDLTCSTPSEIFGQGRVR